MWSLPALKELNEVAFLLAENNMPERLAVAICTKPHLEKWRNFMRTSRALRKLDDSVNQPKVENA